MPTASLPIIDFSAFLHGESDVRRKTADEVVDAFKTYGFVYLVNHGISKDRIQTPFDWVRRLETFPYYHDSYTGFHELGKTICILLAYIYCLE